jgi:hypothetical protein
MSNRAFDTNKLGAGYGFESHPRQAVEMPPTWALVLALGFLMVAMGFWVWQTFTCQIAHEVILTRIEHVGLYSDKSICAVSTRTSPVREAIHDHITRRLAE